MACGAAAAAGCFHFDGRGVGEIPGPGPCIYVAEEALEEEQARSISKVKAEEPVVKPEHGVAALCRNLTRYLTKGMGEAFVPLKEWRKPKVIIIIRGATKRARWMPAG